MPREAGPLSAQPRRATRGGFAPGLVELREAHCDPNLRPLGALRMKIVSQRREQAKRV
jgi:hypothetical protein